MSVQVNTTPFEAISSQDIQYALFGEITSEDIKVIHNCKLEENKQDKINTFINFITHYTVAPHNPTCDCPRFKKSKYQKGEYHSAFCGENPHFEIYRLIKKGKYRMAMDYFNTHFSSIYNCSF